MKSETMFAALTICQLTVSRLVSIARFHLRLASTTEGVIVSNDNFRDLWNDVVAWRDVIEKR